VRLYAVEVRRCRRCGKAVRGQQAEVAADQQGATAHRLGPRVRALGHVLHYRHGPPDVERIDDDPETRQLRIEKVLTPVRYLFYHIEQMAHGELLGPLEHIVLLALVRLEANAYGMTVRREIEKRTGRNISIGAVYATLERLESKGYASSFTGEPTAERGGRAKRLFRIEADGERALRVSQKAIQNMMHGLKSWRTT
jgi:PadR family transcriptional regulator PadR